MSTKKIEIPACLKRVNFFEGRLLTPADLKIEQEYFISQLRLHNRIFHPPGIIAGLEVSIAEAAPCRVVISAGMALDPFGRLTILDLPQTAVLPEQEKMVYIVVYWAERETEHVPVPSGSAGEAALYIEEYAVLKFEKKQGGADQSGITLARLKKTRGKWKLDQRFHPRRAKL